jgi:hypothetical protein
MARRAGLLGLSLLLVLPGCFPTPATSSAALVPSPPFGSGTAASAGFLQDAPAAAPATTEAAVNVARVGLKVVAANPSIGALPHFVTIGGESAPLELFHNPDGDVFITETLARQCKAEGELAALLGTELARIASERGAAGHTAAGEGGPPPTVNVGNDYGGSFGPADGTRMMELAKYERKRALAREQATAPAPDVLARVYLQNAGYNPADVEAVAGLLRAAQRSSKLEKLMSVPAPK